MEIVYTGEPLPSSLTKSIFLAGPTPRSKDVQSWRPEALRILEELGYDGIVFVPEWRSGKLFEDSEKMYVWEDQMLNAADCIAFWVPRNMQTMPALTTNIEWGEWMKSGKVVFGAPYDPDDKRKNKYPWSKAQKYYAPRCITLQATVEKAVEMAGQGALRTGGERFVPLYVWNTSSFQSWYQAQVAAGNRLDWVKAELVLRVGKNKDRVYLWVLHVDVYVAAENRHKDNEVVIGRPDISCVLMYYPGRSLDETSVVLVREFRSPVNNSNGYVWELPGGSSPGVKSAEVIAVEEVFEETGLEVNAVRLVAHGSCQLAATFSSHKAHLYSVLLNDEEFAWLCDQKDKKHGLHPDGGTGELTYVEIKTVREILSDDLVDWSMKGMILSASSSLKGGQNGA